MKEQVRNILLIFSLVFGVLFLCYTFVSFCTKNIPVFTTARYKKEENIQKQNQQDIALKNVPRFIFSEFSLADSPQEIIENALNNFTIRTTFEVNQNHSMIKSYNGESNLPVIVILPKSYTEDVRKFFTKHSLVEHSSPTYVSIDLRLSDTTMKKEIQVDSIELSAKSSHSKIFFYYVTLPNKPAKLFYMKAEGSLIDTVPEEFHKRYGETNKDDLSTHIWVSHKEIALLTRKQLFIIEKAVYDEIFEKIASKNI